MILADCIRSLEESDGRSNWIYQPNAQLKLEKPGFFCLTQNGPHGSTPGVKDVATAFGALAKSDSSAGAGHESDKVLDRDVNTFWASGVFPDVEEHPVALDLDMRKFNFSTTFLGQIKDKNTGKKTVVSAVRIDWEYPALEYTLGVSDDGAKFT